MSDEPRAITADELRDELLDHMRHMARYWANVDSDDFKTVHSKIEGFAHSVLVMLDGCSDGLPAFDLVAKPHEDDKQYNIDNGEDWIEDETRIINMLHEYWYKH
jgi:hypothetical protein